MLARFVVFAVVLAAFSIFLQVQSQRCCRGNQRTGCTDCRPAVNRTYYLKCSDTCYDASSFCRDWTTLCNATLWIPMMMQTCACTCNYCNDTTTTTTTLSPVMAFGRFGNFGARAPRRG